jgi:hypothetical protein
VRKQGFAEESAADGRVTGWAISGTCGKDDVLLLMIGQYELHPLALLWVGGSVSTPKPHTRTASVIRTVNSSQALGELLGNDLLGVDDVGTVLQGQQAHGQGTLLEALN